MSHWPMVELAQIATPVSRPIAVELGKSYRTIGVKWWGGGAYERQTIDGSETAAKSLFLVRNGDLVINKIWVRHGSTAIATEGVDGCAASNEFPTFELDQFQVHNRWIHWLTKTRWFWSECDALSMGTSGKNRIKPEKFLAICIPLPPLNEQRRLVERIDALAAKIEEAKQLRAYADAEQQALISSFTNAVFESVSKEWLVKPLGELAEIRSGVTLGRTIAGPILRIPYLRVANVQDGHLDLRVIKEVEIKEDEAEKWTLKAGDILLTEGGDWDKLGRGTIWRDEIPNCIHQNHIFRVRVSSKIVLPEFLATMTASPYGKSYFQSASKQTTNLASINQRQLKAFPVFVPTLDEQQKLLDRVQLLRSRLETVKAARSEIKVELDAMLPSILDRAFRGELA